VTLHQTAAPEMQPFYAAVPGVTPVCIMTVQSPVSAVAQYVQV